MTLRYFKRCALITLLVSFPFTSAFAGPLHDAAKKGDLAQVKRLLDSGSDINANSSFTDWTPLQYAIKYGGKEVVELLLSKGADPNLKGSYTTPLFFAIYYNGHKEIVELLLSKGADVNAKSKWGRTPLHWAAKRGQKEVVKLLLYGGADPNVKDKKGKTPLYLAANYDQKEVIELLKSYPKIKAELLLKKKRIQEQKTLKSNLLVKTEEKKGDQVCIRKQVSVQYGCVKQEVGFTDTKTLDYKSLK